MKLLKNKTNKLECTYVDADQNCVFNTYTEDTTIQSVAELYKVINSRKDKKRKISKIYVDDIETGKAIVVGYSVKYKDQYDDGEGTFTREDWYVLLFPVEVIEPALKYVSTEKLSKVLKK